MLNVDFIKTVALHQKQSCQNIEYTRAETEGLRGKSVIIY